MGKENGLSTSRENQRDHSAGKWATYRRLTPGERHGGFPAWRPNKLLSHLLAVTVTGWPRLVLLILALVCSFFAWHLPRLRVDRSAEGMFLDHDPDRQLLDKFAATFGLDEILIVAIHCDDVFTRPVLEKISRLTKELWQIDGVVDVISLSSVRDIVGTGDGFNVTPLISTIPGSDGEIAALKARALSNPIYVRHLVAEDAKTTAINIFLENRPDDRLYRARVVSAINKLIEKEQGPEQLYLVGIPKTKVAVTEGVRRGLLELTPLTVLVLAGVVYLCFGTLRGVLLPMGTVLINLIWTLGLLSLTHRSISIVTSFLPSLLVIVGVSYVMYIVGRYYEFVAAGADGRAATARAVEDIAGTVLVSGLTTAIGLAALAISDVRTVKELGMFGALGVLSTACISLTLVPAVLSLLPARQMNPPSGAFLLPSMFLGAVARFVTHRPRVIVFSWGVIILLVTLGAWRLKIETDYDAYFPAGSEIPAAVRRIHEQLSGSVPLYIILEADRPGGVLEPQVLRKVTVLQRLTEELEGVDATLSFADYVKRMHREINQGEPTTPFPSSRKLVAQYTLLYTMSSPTNDLWHYLSADRRQSNVFVRTNLVNSAKMGKAISRIRHVARQVFTDTDIRVSVTGTLALLNKTADAISRGQIYSLVIAFTGVALVLGLTLQSLAAATVALVPNIVPVAAVYGAMGFAGIRLTTATSIIGSMVLGLAIDDTVHYLMRYRREISAGKNKQKAVQYAVGGVGRPMLFTSLALGCGFAVFLLSEFVPLSALGGLTALTMIVALFADLTLLPSLLLITNGAAPLVGRAKANAATQPEDEAA